MRFATRAAVCRTPFQCVTEERSDGGLLDGTKSLSSLSFSLTALADRIGNTNGKHVPAGFGLMALARIRSPEQLRYRAPGGECGQVAALQPRFSSPFLRLVRRAFFSVTAVPTLFSSGPQEPQPPQNQSTTERTATEFRAWKVAIANRTPTRAS